MFKDSKDFIFWLKEKSLSYFHKENKCENCPLGIETECYTDYGYEYDVYYLCTKAEDYKKDYCFTPLFIRKMQYKHRKAHQDKIEEEYWDSLSNSIEECLSIDDEPK